MGSLILTMHVTADGCVADIDGHMWPGFGWPDDAHAALTDLYRTASAVVYGRGTYETVVPFWTRFHEEGDADDMELGPVHREFAAVLAPLPKYVVSTTLDATVAGTQIIRTNPAEKVAALAAEAPGDVLLLAGPRLVGELAAGHLLDEILLIVGPVVLGTGRRLFQDTPDPLSLELRGSHTYSANTVILRYKVSPTPSATD